MDTEFLHVKYSTWSVQQLHEELMEWEKYSSHVQQPNVWEEYSSYM